MPYKVILTRRAIKRFERLPVDAKERISEVLNTLIRTPMPYRTFDVKKLKGLGSAYRIRIGDWRVIYGTIQEEK